MCRSLHDTMRVSAHMNEHNKSKMDSSSLTDLKAQNIEKTS